MTYFLLRNHVISCPKGTTLEPLGTKIMSVTGAMLQDASGQSALLDLLGVELKLHLLPCYCTPRDILRYGTTNRQEHSLILSLPVSLSRFPVGSHVRIRDAADLLRAFEVANRLDLTEAEARHLAGREGVVERRHATNGIGVRLCGEASEDVKLLSWLEPMCLFHLGTPPPCDGSPDTRFFEGQKVRISRAADRGVWRDKVGTIFLRPQPSDDKLLVRYAGQKEELLCPELLHPASSFFGGKTVPESLSLEPFKVGSEVQVRDRDSVLAGFDAAGRDDYFDFMDKFCDQPGVVDLLHPTGGVRVHFDSGISLWYEPPCLQITAATAPDARTGAGRRLLVGQRVRFKHEPSPYHGRLGLIQLHFHNQDYTKVTVRFSDGQEEYVEDSCVVAATSIF